MHTAAVLTAITSRPAVQLVPKLPVLVQPAQTLPPPLPQFWAPSLSPHAFLVLSATLPVGQVLQVVSPSAACSPRYHHCGYPVHHLHLLYHHLQPARSHHYSRSSSACSCSLTPGSRPRASAGQG